MLVSFDAISPQARLWVYQANRLLTTTEVAHISQTLADNLTHWQAHQMPLAAAAQVTDNRFVLLAVDESVENPSGCSIDKSVHWLQALGSELSIDFFDRSLLFFDENRQIKSLPVSSIKSAVSEGIINPNTTVVNTLTTTKAAWLSEGQVAAENTWLKRYFRAIP